MLAGVIKYEANNDKKALGVWVLLGAGRVRKARGHFEHLKQRQAF